MSYEIFLTPLKPILSMFLKVSIVFENLNISNSEVRVCILFQKKKKNPMYFGEIRIFECTVLLIFSQLK